ncbi:hypothetical protein [Sphaerisporangium perillae]|uniref:hypothetical protein n=1 Tax=Sphaerisporangium perillae TaxID=2935860 RepID=UPI00200D01AB|nr:hypothetical protein [Sphaerisporangium perillae]
MRPRLNDDVRFAECPDGVYVHGDYGSCTLRGRQAYAWLARLAPALTGEHTLAELTAQLPGDKRDMVESLVRRLAEQRFVVDARQARPHGLTEAERRTYAEEIAFIGYVLDSPEWRFERLRRSRLVLAGDGPLQAALLEACAGSGWRRISVICPDTAAIRQARDRARRDPGQEVRILPLTGDALPRAIAEEADVLLHVCADIDALVTTARACEAAGIAVGQALVRPTEVWLSQVGRPSVTAVESGWHRLSALPAATPPHSGEDWLTGPVPTVVAAMHALACFSHLTGLDAIGAGAKPQLTRVDLRNLDAVPHRFVRHPLAGTRKARGPDGDQGLETPRDPDAVRGPEGVRAAVEFLASAAPLGAAELLDRAAEVVDSRLGLVGTLDEEGLAQTPLSVCQATVSDPLGALPRWAPPPRAVGWGEDRRTARLRCLLAALATYGVLAGAGADGEEVWGAELPDGRPRPVPAAALRLAGTGGLRVPDGAGAGLSWDEAVAAGLRTHCEALLAARPPTGTAGGAGANPPAGYASDPVAGALARQLALAGEAPDVRDCTSMLGVPALAFTVPGHPPLVSAAATAQAALRDGLERLLLRRQSRTERQSAYSGARPLWAPPGDPAEAVRVMAAALRAAGRVPVAVPLDGDPEAARLLPFVTQVVLLDD